MTSDLLDLVQGVHLPSPAPGGPQAGSTNNIQAPRGSVLLPVPASGSPQEGSTNNTGVPGAGGGAGCAPRTTMPAECVGYYYNLGWSIVPLCSPDEFGRCRYHSECRDVGKRPLTTTEQYRQALPTARELRKWIRKWPKCNLALLTGILSGVIVLDVEPEGIGHPLVQQLPQTVTARSQRGGLHFYFAYAGGLKNRRWDEAGVHVADIRSDRGHIVLPPSRGPKGIYLFFEGRFPGQVPLAPPPDWIITLGVHGSGGGHSPRAAAASTAVVSAPVLVSEIAAGSTVLTEVIHAPDSGSMSTLGGTTNPATAGVPPHIVSLLVNGSPDGQRSEHIMSVLRALCAASYTDDAITQIILTSPLGAKAHEHGTAAASWLAPQLAKARADLPTTGAYAPVLARIEHVVRVASTANGTGIRVSFDLRVGEGPFAGHVIHEGVSTNGDRRRVQAFTAATGVAWWQQWDALPGRLVRVTVRGSDDRGRARIARFFPPAEQTS